MKKMTHLFIIPLLAMVLFAGCASQTTAGNPNHVTLDPENPTTVTVWHYYNGAQQEAFNALVDEFNETQGKEQGIIVESSSQGNVSDLENSVLAAVNQEVGADNLPSIFAAYADTAYAVDKLGLAVDLSPYLTKEDTARFIDSYLAEGQFTDDGSLKIFPIAKSTEIFMLNKTDWKKFAAATGAQVADLATIEGVTKTAQAYYGWTDQLTPAPNDGKAFFGRDAMANYFIIGAKQLGFELFSVENGKPVLQFDQAVMRKLWDNYYIPYVNGYFASSGRFRSDDIKTGNIISFIGSSSGATFFPKEVVLGDDTRYPIQMMVLQCPQFQGGEPYAVQQGAGMVVNKTNDQEMYASVEFLKWFTQDDRNIKFSVASGYLPVTKEANNIELIQKAIPNPDDVVLSIISASIDTVTTNSLYTTKAFEKGTDARNILEYSLSDKATADRDVVLKNLQKGMTLQEAVQPFVTDENFNAWYEKTKSELSALVN